MRIARIVFWIVLLLAAAGVLGWSYAAKRLVESDFAQQIALVQADSIRLQRNVVLVSEGLAPAREPFHAALEDMGVDPPTSVQIAAVAQKSFDLRRFRAGNKISIARGILGDLREVHYRIDTDNELIISSPAPPDPLLAGAQRPDFRAEIHKISSETETTGVSGTIQGSLFESVLDSGERPELAMRLADIFAWDLDFYTDARPGDTFRIVVEKKRLANGETASYGRILLAEYNNAGHPYRAVLFHDASGRPAYFTPDGKAMKRAFLHSPLKFAAAISSHFSTHRYHPILKEYRPHLGIDYAAPTGTPVQTIGDGRVTFAGRKGGAGNLITVQHANGYTTYYMHLSRVLVRTGQHVEQGQRIGLVGMTGLATGPHLDFRIQQHGKFLNFERLGLPTADPVSRREWNEFAAERDQAMSFMPGIPGQSVAAAKDSKPHHGAD